MLSVLAPGKINWTLDILGKREDGYHRMDMLMQPVSLYDELHFEAADGIRLTGENRIGCAQNGEGQLRAEELHFDESNLIHRSAALLKEHCAIREGVSIHLVKRIPFGAGMGGGSADAAATLLALNHLWKVGLSMEELCALGLRLGADIPFMLHGGPARVGGIGEKIAALQDVGEYPLLLLSPCGGLSTGKVFSAYDAHEEEIPHPDTESSLACLQNGRLGALRRCGGNVLQDVLKNFVPEIEKAVQMLYAVGASYAAMTGSGCVVFGAFADEASARMAEEQIRDEGIFCRRVHTLTNAWHIEERKEPL